MQRAGVAQRPLGQPVIDRERETEALRQRLDRLPRPQERAGDDAVDTTPGQCFGECERMGTARGGQRCVWRLPRCRIVADEEHAISRDCVPAVQLSGDRPAGPPTGPSCSFGALRSVSSSISCATFNISTGSPDVSATLSRRYHAGFLSSFSR